MGMGIGMGKSLKLRYANVCLELRPGLATSWPYIRVGQLLNPQPAEVITAGNNLFVFNNECSPTISTQSGHCEDKISVVSK